MASENKNRDLEERTAVFAEKVVDFAKKIQVTPVTTKIIPQIVASGTSIGANYCEAINGESKKDFVHKLSICNKEAKETKYWARILARAVPELKEEARPIWTEATELNLIFSASIRTAKRKKKKEEKDETNIKTD